MKKWQKLHNTLSTPIIIIKYPLLLSSPTSQIIITITITPPCSLMLCL